MIIRREYMIQTQEEPRFKEVRRDAERQLGKLPKNAPIYATIVTHKINDRSWGELKGMRLYSRTAKGTNYAVNIFKRAFPQAGIESGTPMKRR